MKLGDTVKYKGEDYIIYKINKSSVWIGKTAYSKVRELYNDKRKSMRWNAVMDAVGGIQVKTVLLEGDTTGLIRLSYLKPHCEKVLWEIKKEFDKKQGKWKNTHECKVCGTKINPVKFEGEANLLVNVNGEMFYYNFNNRKYFFFKKIF